MPYTYQSMPGGTAQRILKRDSHTCYLCGAHAVEVDHIVNVAAWGSGVPGRHHPDNLAAICVPCHEKKTARERQVGVTRSAQTRAVARKLSSEPHPGRVA